MSLEKQSLHEVYKHSIIEQTLQEFDFFELIGVCFKYILIFLVGNCNKVSALRMTDGAIISGNRLV